MYLSPFSGELPLSLGSLVLGSLLLESLYYLALHALSHKGLLHGPYVLSLLKNSILLFSSTLQLFINLSINLFFLWLGRRIL